MRTLERYLPAGVTVLVLGAMLVWVRRAEDMEGYVAVGNLVLSGGHIYADAPSGLNTWPPFFSLLCVPLALLARPTPYLARFVWIGLNLLLLWAVLRMVARLVNHRPLRWRPDGSALSLAAPEVFLPLLLCLRFVLGNFEHTQVNMLIYALALAGLYGHVRGRDVAGGIALGLSAALKVMPVIFVPYLCYRRRYTTAATMTLATIAFSLSPAFVYGWPRFFDYVASWWHAVDVGWGVSKMNQSVFAMFDRYVGYGVASTVEVPKSLAESGTLAPWIATYATLAVVIALAAHVFGGEGERGSPALLAEYGVVFIVSAIFGPVCWKSYLVVLLLPCALLVELLRAGTLGRGPRTVVIAGLVTYALLGALPAADLFPKHTATAIAMLSLTTIGALVLLATLLWLRTRLATDSTDGNRFSGSGLR